ncbi:MAG: pyridoxamine 5'-phosphate oxidase family protein [Anaerolineae bacterium]|nr:pyridoxamine 5'-phosphate oxidase family protein [Anaerolineae bacterium]
MFTAAQARYLRQVVIPVRLACVTASGWPAVLSLWYLYEDGLLKCATQASARVVAYLRNEPRCAFEVAADVPPYCGVRGQGRADIDDTSGAEVLARLLERYVGDLDTPLARQLLRRSDSEVAIVIRPLQVFAWDFTDRMADTFPELPPKICPA